MQAGHGPNAQTQQPREQRQVPETHIETRRFFCDVVIAVIVGIIALLLYRRLSMFSDISSPASTPDPHDG